MPDFAAERYGDAHFTFYVPLWKRAGIPLDLFDNYWADVHGPVCARLPGQFQYWQFHVGHAVGGTFPVVEGVDYVAKPDQNFDGIAELTFKTDEDRQTWFTAAGILMDDEHNLFSKAIGYVTDKDHSKTFVDQIEDGEPDADLAVNRYHVTFYQKDGVSVDAFRGYLQEFAEKVCKHDDLLKLRLHCFNPPDTSRPDAAGVAHAEPEELQFQASIEFAWKNRLKMEQFFASAEYQDGIARQADFVRQVCPFPERFATTYVYGGEITLQGIRGARTAKLITSIGATNQLAQNIREHFGIK